MKTVKKLFFAPDHGVQDSQGWFISPCEKGELVYFELSDGRKVLFQTKVGLGEVVGYGTAVDGPRKRDKLLQLALLEPYAANKLLELDGRMPAELKDRWMEISDNLHLSRDG